MTLGFRSNDDLCFDALLFGKVRNHMRLPDYQSTGNGRVLRPYDGVFEAGQECR